MENCLKCGTPLEASNGKGRPKAYCSTACCRVAEYEVRRINSRLEKLEDELSNARLGRGWKPQESVEKLRSEIAIYEERLRVLLEAKE